MSTVEFVERLERIADAILLAEHFSIFIGHDDENDPGRWYFQITCWRRDVITGEMGRGFGGKAYLSPHMTDSELIQIVFGLYKSYFEHEARETFMLRNSAGEARRPFGPHIDTWALWDVARRVDVRSARHVEDRSEEREQCGRTAPHEAHRPIDSLHPLCPGVPDPDDLGMKPTRDRHYDFGGSLQ